jgi:cytochrome c biogenesis protein CcmG, thiol:disulfide interchange protein DsbE
MNDLMTRRRAIVMRAGALLAFLVLAFSPRCAAPSPMSLLHKPAPEFARKDIHGQRVDLAAFRGRVVLLTFWATWCAPCQIEMPHFVQWQQELGLQGFQIVAISMDDDAAPVLGLARKRNVNYPVIMGDGQLAALYGGILGLPVTFLIDRHGKIAAVFKGEARLNLIHAELLRLLHSQ